LVENPAVSVAGVVAVLQAAADSEADSVVEVLEAEAPLVDGN
jgi:hypothetical protein